MSNDFITHSVLAGHLGVSDLALRRLADAYGEVYGALPRVSPTNRHRLFPLIVVERIQAARQLMRDVPGMRAADAFKVVRDGMTLPHLLADLPGPNSLAAMMTELNALHSEVTNLRGEVASLRTLLLAVLGQHKLTSLPSEPIDLLLNGSVATLSTRQVPPQWSAACERSASFQPGLTRLLSDLEAGYTLLEVRGDVVLMTPSGQQVRLVDPRTVAALVKQGWIVRDGHGLRLTAPPLIASSPAEALEP